MKQTKKTLVVLLGLLALVLALAACTSNNVEPATPRTITDREGYTITLPGEINTIITLGPSNAEILVALGLASNIIATDSFSADVAGLGTGVARAFGITDFDAEYITELMPDIIFASGGLSRAGEEDGPMAPVAAAGITVLYMPTSTSIAEIMEDIRFIADVMGVNEASETVIADMQSEIDAISRIAAGITQTRTVYFEISPSPWMFSFGTGTFLHEIIELIGATNIFAGIEGWHSVSEEELLELNPDIILTSVDFMDDPIAEIMGRPGFDAIIAVQNEAVFSIDANASNRPSQHIVIALRQIAQAVFPEYFQ